MFTRVAFTFQNRPIRRAVRVFVVLAIIWELVLPLPALAAAYTLVPLIAELTSEVSLSLDGRAIRDIPNGVTLATVQGAALVNPAMPVTARGLRGTARRLVAPGTAFRILATGYSSTRDQTDATPFVTASGTHVHDGTVAINFLSFGTKVRFLDYRPAKVYVVEDRHHPRLSDRADLWFSSRQDALDFGARVLRMEVVE